MCKNIHTLEHVPTKVNEKERMVKPNLIALTKLAVLSRVNLPNSPQKLAIAKAFAEANYVFFAFASAIFLPR